MSRWALVITFFIVSPYAWACNEKEAKQVKVDVSYDQVIKDEVIVELQKAQGKKEFLLDDTGYLGGYLVLLSLLETENSEGKIDHLGRASDVKFFKERLTKLRQSLLPFDNGLVISGKIKEINDAFDFGVQAIWLQGKWSELQGLLSHNEIQIMARRKAKVSDQWSATETNIIELNLPEYKKTRSVSSCAKQTLEFSVKE